MSVNQVTFHLELVIQQWVNREPGSYGPALRLATLWSQANSVIAFETEGVRRLLLALRRDTLFAPCPRTHALTPGMFSDGGLVKTCGDLQAFLSPCAGPVFQLED